MSCTFLGTSEPRWTAGRLPVNPQLFRDCAATSIAIEAPDHVGIIMPVLGHARATTGERYYNQARSLEAARRFQAVIDGFRNEP